MPDEVTLAGKPLHGEGAQPMGRGGADFDHPWDLLPVLMFWWYSINREMRDLGRVRAVDGLGEHPGVSTAAFSGLAMFTLYISLVWTVATTTRRVRRAQLAAGHSGELNAWISAALWIFTLGIGGMVYTQSELNKAWRAQEPSGQGGGAGTNPSESPPFGLQIEDPEEWPDEHPAAWDAITRRAYQKRYGKPPGA